jgi:heptosyltransferase-2/heptosyltransferase-3
VSGQRPLIVRFAAFGDVVLLTTLIEVLHRRYGERVDLLGSGPWTPPLLAADPRVGELCMVTSRKTPYPFRPSQWGAVRWLRRRGAGPVYLCDPEPKAAWLLQRAGVPAARVLRAHDFPAEPGTHWCEWWLATGQRTPSEWAGRVPALAEATLDHVPQLHLAPTARHAAAAWLAARGWAAAPLVLIQAGNKRTLKRGRLAAIDDAKYWPPERWAAVARGVLGQLPDARVLLCGVPAEHGVLEAIRIAAGHEHVHNGARELPVPRLLALLERAHSMISVDTGPAHAAAALDCPLTVLFANQDLRLWRPRSRAGRVATLGGERGAASRLVDIEVPAVLAAWTAQGGRI